MLARHARRAALSNATRLASPHINTIVARRPQLSRPLLASPSSGFHSSARQRNELPKSPFQTFVDVLKEEIQKSRELQDSTKQVSGHISKLQDSEALKRTKEFYERARLISSIKDNPRLKAAADELRKSGAKVGDAVQEALKSMEESDFMRGLYRASAVVSKGVAEATEPIRKTEAYKALADTILDALDDSGSSRHAGYEEKEVRRLRRKMRLEKAGRAGGLNTRTKVVADENAGEALVIHKDNAKREKWENLKESHPLFKAYYSLRQQYDESENPVVSGMRSVTSTIGSWFDETETAQVVRLSKYMDPTFTVESFSRELREYIIPEVVDAYLTADREMLQRWCGEATYNVLWATMEQYLKQGLISQSRVLDIRHVDVLNGKVLEDDVPAWIVTFQTQEILLFRNAMTKEIVVGAEDKVEQCQYVAVISRSESHLDDEVTGGWKVVEMARRSARAFI